MKFAIIGYGSQGRAQAMNLRDSGIMNIIIVLYDGSESISLAEKEGFVVNNSSDAVHSADVIVMLAPDELHKEIYDSVVAPALRSGQTIIFAHGFSVFYNLVQISQCVNVCMVSPKSVGTEVRNQYLRRKGVVCFTAIKHDFNGKAKVVADSYAAAVMLGNLIIETTFKEETEVNLFSEQVVLCGGIPSLIMSAFETLVERGFSPELAYLGCLHEVKLIADLMYQKGIYGMFSMISNTAGYGASIVGDRIVTREVKEEMGRILDEICSRHFFREFTIGQESSLLSKRQEMLRGHEIETIGSHLREMMQEML